MRQVWDDHSSGKRKEDPVSKCPLRSKTGKHVYKYEGDQYKCGCGRTVKYDIVARDFVAEDK